MRFNRKIGMALCLAFITCMTLQMILPVNSIWYNSARAASKIKINKTKATLTVGKTLQLKVSGTKNKVTWSSSDKKIATVTTKGKVTAKKVGTATITAKIGKKKLTCKITVKNEEITFTIKPNESLPIDIKVKNSVFDTVEEYTITGFDYDIIPTSGGFKCKLYFSGIKTLDVMGEDHYSSCQIEYRLNADKKTVDLTTFKAPKVRLGETWSLESCFNVTKEITGNPSDGVLFITRYIFQ